MAVTLTIPVDSIVVGERRREELGDIAGLAEDIRQHGLLHPIIVDIEKNLIAGGRRLEAVKLLGWERVTVSMNELASEAERREIELAENLHRKDFTPYELSRNLVALAETAAEVDKEQAGNNGETVPENQRGRPERLGSLRRVADRIGVDKKSIQNARQHVAAVEAHPELKDEPQATALDYAKAVKEEPALAGSPIVSVVEHYRAHPRRRAEQPPLAEESDAALLAKLPPKIEEPENVQAYRLLWHAIYRVRDGAPPKGVLHGPRPDEIAAMMPTPKEGAELLQAVKALEEWCAKMREALEREMATPLRAVK